LNWELKKKAKQKQSVNDVSLASDDVHIEVKNRYNFFLALLTPSLPLLGLQTGLQIGHFIYAILLVLDSSWDTWNQYQALGTIMINSGLLNNISQVVLYLVMSQPDESNPLKEQQFKRFAITLIVLQVGITSPFFLTHSLPGIILYIWMVIPFVMLFGIAFYIFWHGKFNLSHNLGNILGFLWFRVAPFVGTIILQTGYNYMILFYDSTSYAEVISYEWHLRNTYCYRTRMETSAEHIFAFSTYF